MALSNIPVEIFARYIVEKLRRENPHLNYAVDESDHVLGGSVVHIPQAGASPQVVKNRNTFPATAVMRGDSGVTYALDVYSTDPEHVSWHERNEISYDKTDSVMNDHVATLVESIGDNTLYNWIVGIKTGTTDAIPAANMIRTSGVATAVNPEDGQTGTRKAFVAQDLSNAEARMNKMSVPKTGRCCIIESYMYQQLMDSLSGNMMAAFQQAADLKNGVLGMLYGFNIMTRSSVLAFDSTDVPLIPGQALAGNSNLAALCWQKDCVAKATGDIKPFADIDSPTYYGDVFSALVKFGGRARREDWKGVLTITQAA